MIALPAPIARAHRILAILSEHDDSDVMWFRETVRLWLQGAAWDAAAGLGDGWRANLADTARQTALAGLAGVLAPSGGLSKSALAGKLSAFLGRYETTAWRTNRAAGRRPPGTAGLAHDYLLAKGPTSGERIRNIMSQADWSPKPMR